MKISGESWKIENEKLRLLCGLSIDFSVRNRSALWWSWKNKKKTKEIRKFGSRSIRYLKLSYAIRYKLTLRQSFFALGECVLSVWKKKKKGRSPSRPSRLTLHLYRCFFVQFFFYFLFSPSATSIRLFTLSFRYYSRWYTEQKAISHWPLFV